MSVLIEAKTVFATATSRADRCLTWVKPGNAQIEHKFSGLPLITDMRADTVFSRSVPTTEVTTRIGRRPCRRNCWWCGRTRTDGAGGRPAAFRATNGDCGERYFNSSLSLPQSYRQAA